MDVTNSFTVNDYELLDFSFTMHDNQYMNFNILTNNNSTLFLAVDVSNRNNIVKSSENRSHRKLENPITVYYNQTTIYGGDMLKGESIDFEQTQMALLKSDPSNNFDQYSCYQPEESFFLSVNSFSFPSSSSTDAQAVDAEENPSIIELQAITNFNTSDLLKLGEYFPRPESEVFINIDAFLR
jgi:hypothetical protein